MCVGVLVSVPPENRNPAASYQPKHLLVANTSATTAMQALRQSSYIEFRPHFHLYLLFMYFGAHFCRVGGFFRLSNAPRGGGRRPAGGLGIFFRGL
jgi:hypothetical protein